MSAYLSRTSSAKTTRTHYTDYEDEDDDAVQDHTDAFLTEVETEDEESRVQNFIG